MKLKKDFRSRLVLLRDAIYYTLELDESNDLSTRLILFPRLYSVFSLLWCDKSKVFNYGSRSIKSSRD